MDSRLIPALALAFAAAPDLRADVLCMSDGRIFDGLKMERAEGGVTVRFENGDVFVPDSLIMESLIEGDPDFVPRTDEERELVGKGLVPFEGRWISVRRRDREIEERIEERREAIEEMRAHREWRNRYQEETRNFNFQYTVPKPIFADYRDKMEAYFEAFAKDWRIKRSRRSKLNVCFYGSRKEFHRTSGAGRYVLGYFKFVGEYDLNVYYDRLDPAYTEDVMFHEANHYLQKLINEEFSYPHWPGEALAEYYGASDWDPETKKLETGLIQEGRLVAVRNDIDRGKEIGLRELITTEGMYEHYTWGWTLVHFLMNDSRYASRFQKFFLALANGRDVERQRGFGQLETVSAEEVYNAFRKYLGLRSEEDVQELEAEWHHYVTDELEHATTSGLEKAAVAAMGTGRPLRAKRLFQEAIEAGSENPRAFYKYGEVLFGEGEREAAIEQWRTAIALDPMTADYHFALGMALAESDAKESERRIALAREIEPEADFDWIEVD